jgi:outer membrane receptor protein involved in Fe transport
MLAVVRQRKLQLYQIGFTPFDTDQKAGGHAAAVFGDVNWRLSPAARLNLGLRYTRDTKDGVSASSSDLPFFVVDPPPDCVAVVERHHGSHRRGLEAHVAHDGLRQPVDRLQGRRRGA